MKNNLYYTPIIEEFHVGFECEWQCKIIKETWGKQICDTDLVNIAYSTFEHADEEEPFDEQFRVKYLDKSDIESLGFKSAGGYSGLINFELSTGTDDSNTKENQWKLSFTKLNNKVVIEQYRWTRFYGTIKNKSELIKLMQQLNIK